MRRDALRLTSAVAVVLAVTACAPPGAPPPAPSVAQAADTARDWQEVELRPQVTAGIAWAETGSGDPLVLLNGTGSPMAEWDPGLLAALGSRHRVLVLDYPGLGQSPPLRRRLTFDRLADAVADWLSALDLRRVPVLGWSMGTFVAQRLAVRHPEVVDRLVLVGGNPGGPNTVLGPRWVQRADSDPEYSTATYLRTNYPATRCAQAAGREFLRRQAAAVRTGRYPPDRVPARTYDAMVAAEDPWLRSATNVRQLRGVTVPALVLVGDRDVITPPPNSRRMARRLAQGELVLIAGAGHSVLFQEPQLTAAIVTGFLAGRSPAGRRLSGAC